MHKFAAASEDHLVNPAQLSSAFAMLQEFEKMAFIPVHLRVPVAAEAAIC